MSFASPGPVNAQHPPATPRQEGDAHGTSGAVGNGVGLWGPQVQVMLVPASAASRADPSPPTMQAHAFFPGGTRGALSAAAAALPGSPVLGGPHFAALTQQIAWQYHQQAAHALSLPPVAAPVQEHPPHLQPGPAASSGPRGPQQAAPIPPQPPATAPAHPPHPRPRAAVTSSPWAGTSWRRRCNPLAGDWQKVAARLISRLRGDGSAVPVEGVADLGPSCHQLPADLDRVPFFLAPYKIPNVGVSSGTKKRAKAPIDVGSGLWLLPRKGDRCEETRVRSGSVRGHTFKSTTCRSHRRRVVDRYCLAVKAGQDTAPAVIQGIVGKFVEEEERQGVKYKCCRELAFWEVSEAQPARAPGQGRGEDGQDDGEAGTGDEEEAATGHQLQPGVGLAAPAAELPAAAGRRQLHDLPGFGFAAPAAASLAVVTGSRRGREDAEAGRSVRPRVEPGRQLEVVFPVGHLDDGTGRAPVTAPAGALALTAPSSELLPREFPAESATGAGGAAPAGSGVAGGGGGGCGGCGGGGEAQSSLHAPPFDYKEWPAASSLGHMHRPGNPDTFSLPALSAEHSLGQQPPHSADSRTFAAAAFQPPRHTAARVAEEEPLSPERLSQLSVGLLLAVFPPYLAELDEQMQRDLPRTVQRYIQGLSEVLQGVSLGAIRSMALPEKAEVRARLLRETGRGEEAAPGEAGGQGRERDEQGQQQGRQQQQQQQQQPEEGPASDPSATSIGAATGHASASLPSLPAPATPPLPHCTSSPQQPPLSRTGPVHWAVSPSLDCCFDVGRDPEDRSTDGCLVPGVSNRLLPGVLQVAALATMRRHIQSLGGCFEEVAMRKDSFRATALIRACRYRHLAAVSWLCGAPQRFGLGPLLATLEQLLPFTRGLSKAEVLAVDAFWKPHRPSRQFLLHTTNEGFQAHHSATRQGVAGLDAACIALEAIHMELKGDKGKVLLCTYFLNNKWWRQAGGAKALCAAVKVVLGCELTPSEPDPGEMARHLIEVRELVDEVQGLRAG